jgi:PmbA protein
VLGPWAVAEVLRRAAGAFAGAAALDGPLGGRFGTRAVAPCINLSDSPRYPATLPRSFDAEGVPVQPVPLVQDGVANRAVHDSTTSAAAGTASTGHAARPAGLAPPRAEHLVLVGGGAVDPDELAAPLGRGLVIASLSPGDGPGALAQGVRVIRDGRIAEPARSVTVSFDPLELLSHAHALTAAQRTVPAPPGAPAWALGATVCPWLRAGAGLHVSS